MLTVGAFEAKAKIAELLDKVAAGESVLITRRGDAAALLVSPKLSRAGRTETLAELRAFREQCHVGHDLSIEALIETGRP